MTSPKQRIPKTPLDDLQLLNILKYRLLDARDVKSERTSGTYNRADPTRFENFTFEFSVERVDIPGLDPEEDENTSRSSARNVIIKIRDVCWGEDIIITIWENVYEDWEDRNLFATDEEYYQEFLEKRRAEAHSKKIEINNYVNHDNNPYFVRSKPKDMRKMLLALLETERFYSLGCSFQVDPYGELADYE